MNKIFYVYAYLRKDYTPYYIGKGKNKRAWDKNHSVIVPKDKSRIIIIQEELTELQSFILERYYIRWFGRKDLGTGILRNRTDGGEGSSGTKYTEEQRKQMSISRSGKNHPNWNKKHSEELKQKIRITNTGKKQSTETINKKINSMAKYYSVTTPHGEVLVIKNLKLYCKINNLNSCNMYEIANGNRKIHKGYSCKKITRV